MSVGYLTHPSFSKHAMPGYNHPESPERIKAVWNALDHAQLTPRLTAIEPVEATREILRAVHTETFIRLLERLEAENRPVLIDQDTYALPRSFQIARLAAGACVRGVEAVVRGDVHTALAAIRPPGHHATPNNAMGFCLLSNVAIAARYATQQLGLERVLILDYDVHHGNGTQDAFYDDPRVLFISTHQSPFYPMTGHLEETGTGAGVGATLNVPLPNNTGDSGYQQVFEQIVWPAARRYQPQLIIVSAGFDAHWADPLAQMRLTLAGYDQLARSVLNMANELCGGRVVFVMEGGYNVTALGSGMRNIAHRLLGDDDFDDPLGDAPPSHEPDLSALVAQIVQLHRLG
ncbi:histone deacetylase [Aggregatilineales bacterium SYSU G02658]